MTNPAVHPHALREYALLADGHRGALSGPHGAITWMCVPQWHNDAVFTALLGGQGHYTVRPVEPCVWSGSYEPRSLIWRHQWTTHYTQITCREALAYPGQRDTAVLLRRIEANNQDLKMRIELDAKAGFGKHPLRDTTLTAGGHWLARTGDLWLRWSGAAAATMDSDGAWRAEITIPAGQRHDLVLELGALPDAAVAAQPAWEDTAKAWSTAVPAYQSIIAPRDAEHAYAVLRGMTLPGGGMAAAASMSLPERTNQSRDYDYRYSWIRDQCYAGIAVAAHGDYSLLDDAVRFLTARVLDDGDNLAPAYTVNGESVPHETELDLPGYPGSRTVTAGNHAAGQWQLDAFGELLQLFATAARHQRLDADGWRGLRLVAAQIERRWTVPDAGIWELDDDWWSHSRLSCVAGLRAVSRITSSPSEAGRLSGLADVITAETHRRCLNPAGFWQRSPTRKGPDASLVLPPVRGALPATDPRTRQTLRTVKARLASQGYMYRFRHTTADLGEAEGAFLLCGFWMALAEQQQGEALRAMRWFERARGAYGPPGLFAEEYDVRQRQLRGNLPQAFVHAALLECVAYLTNSPDRTRDDVGMDNPDPPSPALSTSYAPEYRSLYGLSRDHVSRRAAAGTHQAVSLASTVKGCSMETDIITVVTADHRAIEARFEELEGGGQDPKQRRESVVGLIAVLVRHASLEAQSLYPAIRDQVPGGDRLADPVIEQHAEAERAMQDLEDLDVADPDFDEKLNTLVEIMRQHITQVEQQLLPPLRQRSSSEQLENLRREAADDEDEPPRAHRESFGSPDPTGSAGEVPR